MPGIILVFHLLLLEIVGGLEFLVTPERAILTKEKVQAQYINIHHYSVFRYGTWLLICWPVCFVALIPGIVEGENTFSCVASKRGYCTILVTIFTV